MLMGYTISRHLLEERSERVAAIGRTIGFGEIEYKFQSANNRGDRIEAITTTGIIVVLAINEKLIITMYPATLEKVCALFKGKGENVPQNLRNTIKRNQKYMKMCK